MKDFKDKLKGIQNHFFEYLKNIRTGRANPSLLDDIEVEAYGTKTSITQLASITVQDAKSILTALGIRNPKQQESRCIRLKTACPASCCDAKNGPSNLGATRWCVRRLSSRARGVCA